MSEPACPGCRALERRVRELEAQVRDLLAKLKTNASNSSTPPSANPLGADKPVKKEKSELKRGGQPDHPPHLKQMLPPERVTRTKHFVPDDWANDPTKPWTELDFDQFGLHTRLAVKTQQALYYKAGGQRLLNIVLTRDKEGKRPDCMFYCTKLDCDARQILSTYAYRWAIECAFENCKQFLGLEDPANRLPKAVARTAPLALLLATLVVVWFHQSGHRFLRFPFRPWYQRKKEPSFADLLTTLRRLSYDDKTRPLVPKRCRLKTWLSQLTELLSRAA